MDQHCDYTLYLLQSFGDIFLSTEFAEIAFLCNIFLLL